MATVNDLVRLTSQFHEIVKRVENESLTIEQVREAFQALITAPHSKRCTPINELGLENYGVLDRLHGKDIHTTLDLAKYSEIQICDILIGDNDGFPMTNQRISWALDRFVMIRGLMEIRGLRFKGERHDRRRLYEMF
jgi:hypothetical protein